MITSAIKKQTSVYCSISLNPYMVFLKLGITNKKLKRKAILIVSLLLMSAATTNRSLYANIVFKSYIDKTLFTHKWEQTI